MCDFGLASPYLGSKNAGVFKPPSYRSVRTPREKDAAHFWTTTYTGTRLSGRDVDFYAYVQMCVTILFHHDATFVMHVRNTCSFPDASCLAPFIRDHPNLKDFFYVGRRLLEERSDVFGDEWTYIGGMLMQSMGGSL